MKAAAKTTTAPVTEGTDSSPGHVIPLPSRPAPDSEAVFTAWLDHQAPPSPLSRVRALLWFLFR